MSRCAAKLALDSSALSRALGERKFVAKVAARRRGGEIGGVTNAPAFFINDERYAGKLDQNDLFEAIAEAGLRRERDET